MGACVLCKDQITNPLSPQRLTQEMTTWLGETKPELIAQFVEESQSLLNKEVASDDYCIINGNPMDVCVYCFTEHMFRWLDEQHIEASLMDEYVTYFNFDITGQGYMKSYEDKYVRVEHLFNLDFNFPQRQVAIRKTVKEHTPGGLVK